MSVLLRILYKTFLGPDSNSKSYSENRTQQLRATRPPINENGVAILYSVVPLWISDSVWLYIYLNIYLSVVLPGCPRRSGYENHQLQPASTLCLRDALCETPAATGWLQLLRLNQHAWQS